MIASYGIIVHIMATIWPWIVTEQCSEYDIALKQVCRHFHDIVDTCCIWYHRNGRKDEISVNNKISDGTVFYKEKHGLEFFMSPRRDQFFSF